MENLPKGVVPITWKDGRTTYQYQGKEYDNVEDIRGFLGFPLRSSKAPELGIMDQLSKSPLAMGLLTSASRIGELTELPGEKRFAEKTGESAQQWGLPYWVGETAGYLVYPGFGEAKALTKSMKAAQLARKSSQLQPVGLLAESAYIARTTDGPLVNNVFKAITKETEVPKITKGSPEYEAIFNRAGKHIQTEGKLKGFGEKWIDSDSGILYRVGTDKGKLVPINLDSRKLRYQRRYGATQLDEKTLLKQLGGDQKLLKQYKQTNRSIVRNLKHQVKKLNEAGKAKFGDKWVNMEVEHIFDAQYYWKTADDVPNFAGKGGDEAMNLTVIPEDINRLTGAQAAKTKGAEGLVKNIDKFVDYERATREFVDFDMFNTVKNMKTNDWEGLLNLVLENPNMNVHEVLVNYF